MVTVFEKAAASKHLAVIGQRVSEPAPYHRGRAPLHYGGVTGGVVSEGVAPLVVGAGVGVGTGVAAGVVGIGLGVGETTLGVDLWQAPSVSTATSARCWIFIKTLLF